jgi:nicotinic acid phosphoribosyltransferase
MVALSRQVRRILDQAGLPEVKIFASSGFDEYVLERLIADGGLHRCLRRGYPHGNLGRCPLPGHGL